MTLKLKSAFLALILMGAGGCYSSDHTLVPKPPPERKVLEESYAVKYQPMVDILFVVDDSGSMGTHQQNLATNISKFTAAMEKNKFLDYHIGVVSTSMDKPALAGVLRGNPSFVTRETDFVSQFLAKNITDLGTSGDYIEKMADPIYVALGPNTAQINPGFLRPEAFLVVILITDAEEQSELVTNYKAYDTMLRSKSGDENKVLGYGVLSYPDLFGDRCASDGNGQPVINEMFMSMFSNAHNSLVSTNTPGPLPGSRNILTNIFSLCDADYGQKLANIGEDIRIRVSRKLPLPRLPVRGTIHLKYGTQFVDPKWWKYDPTSQSLILLPGIELVEEEGAQFSVVLDQSNPNETIGVPPEGEVVGGGITFMNSPADQEE
ncbi:MAG: hypothetical protein M9899_09820 [Bdellovibrionaceae bacterium]|nr:hypothetical protein [Pseudobdellovibrionaceae bacterium]